MKRDMQPKPNAVSIPHEKRVFMSCRLWMLPEIMEPIPKAARASIRSIRKSAYIMVKIIGHKMSHVKDNVLIGTLLEGICKKNDLIFVSANVIMLIHLYIIASFLSKAIEAHDHREVHLQWIIRIV